MIEDTGQKNLTENWMNNIFLSLSKIELYERRTKEGVDDLVEYIQAIGYRKKDIIDELMFKNAKIMISELSILLPNIKNILKVDEFNKIDEKLESMKLLINNRMKDKAGNIILSYKILHDEVKHKTIFRLLPPFDIVIEGLEEIRSNIVDNLKEILFLKGNLRSQKPNV